MVLSEFPSAWGLHGLRAWFLPVLHPLTSNLGGSHGLPSLYSWAQWGRGWSSRQGPRAEGHCAGGPTQDGEASTSWTCTASSQSL